MNRPATPRTFARCWAPPPARSTTSAGTRRCRIQARLSPSRQASPRAPDRRRGDVFALHATSMGFPPRLGLGAGLLEVHVGVDMVDPRQRNEVVLAAGVGVVLGQLDLVTPFQLVHGPDVDPVGA